MAALGVAVGVGLAAAALPVLAFTAVLGALAVLVFSVLPHPNQP